jgi:hypothetical protein
VAQLLHDAGIGVYDPSRLWTASDTDVAIVIGELPQDPPQVLALEHYAVRDDPRLNDTVAAIQIRNRGDENPATVQGRDDAVFSELHGRHDEVVNGVPLVLCWRQSLLPMPTDQNHRRQSSANYYNQVAWPTRFRTD